MSLEIVVVDAFTSRAFAGNPAAVCWLSVPRDPAWMQDVAREMNLSETAFVHLEAGGGQALRLRWFTPELEVKLCGHATLATAHVLWTERGMKEPELAFHTLSGVLRARKQADGRIALDFPAKPVDPADPPRDLLRALSIVDADVLSIGVSEDDWIVELASAATVRGLRPDFGRLREVDARAVIVTARGEQASGFDFVSRFFGPNVGIDEDPVTGSAHCRLATHWAARLGKTRMRAHQASRRGGEIDVELVGDRVLLVGSAVTMLRGRLADAMAGIRPEF